MTTFDAVRAALLADPERWRAQPEPDEDGDEIIAFVCPRCGDHEAYAGSKGWTSECVNDEVQSLEQLATLIELAPAQPNGNASARLRAADLADAIGAQAPGAAAAEANESAQGQEGRLGEWDAGDDTVLPPPRGWLLGNSFCRRFVSSLLADGGVGKTALRLAQLISLATGRSQTGEHVFQRCRVLIVSLEDDIDELRRRVLAVLLRYGIDRVELKGWLFLATPGASGGKLMIEQDGTIIRSALAGRIEEAVTRRQIDIVSLDPFVKSHGVEENSNHAIDAVIQLLADMAADYDIAVDIPHHTSKGITEPGNANRGRGATAMKDGARLVYTLTPMSPEEAQTFGIKDEERRFLVRMDSGKVNITPPLASAKWFRLVGVTLGNSSELYPHGDEVQTVEPWEPPDTWGSLSGPLLDQILTAIDAGQPDGNRYSDAPSVKDRAAWRVVVEHAPHKTEAQAREIIKVWVKNGVLYHEEYENPMTRKPVKGLRVEPIKRPR